MAIKEVAEIIEEISPYYKNLKKEKPWEVPSEMHRIVYDSPSETLEPVYYWVLDMMNAVAGKTEKLVDTFASSVGSGHFSELMGKATRMQEEVMKIMGTTNTIIKSIINLIYDLKEWEVRLDMYKKLKSEKPFERDAALLSLKQVWMDNVDIKRGRGSINMMAQDLQFVTLRDAFMAAQNAELKGVDGSALDLNDRVIRVLKPRVQEFYLWKDRSEIELNKRYKIEIAYLKSQVNALKMYTRWSRPYLKAASELEQKDMGRNASIVNAFNTIVLELSVMGTKPVDALKEVVDKNLPRGFEKEKAKKMFAVVLVDFKFRGIPNRVGQNYAFGGRAEVVFRAYGLNEDEIKKLYQEIDKSDISEAMKLVSGMTDESLGLMQKEIDAYIKLADGEEKKEEKPDDMQNPFAALFGLKDKKKEEEKKADAKKPIGEIKKDSYVESVLRQIAIANARSSSYAVFDVYKKAHGMASHPSPFGG